MMAVANFYGSWLTSLRHDLSQGSPLFITPRRLHNVFVYNALHLLLVLDCFKTGYAVPDSEYFPYETSLLTVDKAEYQRLLQQYPINQELVKGIGKGYYQIVNVAQYHHHQYSGLSTREGTSKGPRSQPQGMQATQQLSRTGKHFHRTSFIIQAFNHKFRLILELNPTLIAPNVLQKHIFSGNAEQRERNELEMCYYHGNVEGLEWSAAAVRTCNGLSGIIHMGNETFIIHPFYGGDMSTNHPHIFYEAKSVGRQTCGNKRNFEWNFPSGVSGINDYVSRRNEDKIPLYFIELAVLLDRAMFDKRNSSTRLQVIHDALQIVNIADLYFRKLSTAISVVYVETWHQSNYLNVGNRDDLRQTLVQLTDHYGPKRLFTVNRDSSMLITGYNFSESGMGVPNTICTPQAMGVVADVDIYQPHITGVALAHMIGHNLNMGHDEDWDNCHCPNWYGCIMSESIVGKDGIQPYRFSDCSRSSYFTSINQGHAMCLQNKPNSVKPTHETCGNGVVDQGEQCDCGTIQECSKDPCCEPRTCRLRSSAECSMGQPCCENCKFKGPGAVCRPRVSECDIEELCTGQTGECPLNTYKKNGAACGNNQGYCFNGACPTLDSQCQSIWDYGAKKANDNCYDQFNKWGHHNGHCGRDQNGDFRKCALANVMCGSLHCKDGKGSPIMQHKFTSTTVSKTTISINGVEHECKNMNSPLGDVFADLELVRNGTRCGDGKICMNQTCVALAPFLDNSRCPSNHVGYECSGHGDCSNVNVCHCHRGWEGSDCSVQSKEPITTPRPLTPPPSHNQSAPTADAKVKTTKKGSLEDSSNTIILVFGMVSVVGGVFILFAGIALCYRRSSVPKFEPAYPPFNPKSFKLPQPQQPAAAPGGAQPAPQPPQLNHEEFDNRILSFTQLPAYRVQHSIGMTGSMKNLGATQPQDDETGDETSAFLGTPNSVGGNRFPEKGILKKFAEEDGSQSDNNDAMCDVERTLKSLNGYHEDILAALRVAAAQRLGDTNSTPPPQGGARLSEGYPDYPEFGSEFPLLRNSNDRIPQGQPADDESNDDTGGPIRIRNLEDLLRQLEHHSGTRHLSPCGSEDIRMSETEADRHYRLHSGELDGDEEEGFVLGRYRGPRVDPDVLTPLTDFDHFTSSILGSLEDELESCIDGKASPFCPCYFCNQPNLIHTSTSEDEEDRAHVSRSRSLTPRNLKHLYNPSDESQFGSQSPLHVNGIPSSVLLGHYQNQYHASRNNGRQPTHKQ